jgi:hypothetical protein
MLIRFISFIFFIVNTNGLTPSNYPSGKHKIYNPNSCAPSSDLILLNRERTRFIAKHWENNILHCGREIRKEDEHILRDIDELYDILRHNDAFDKRIMYISWCPLGAIREILFLVVAEINIENNTFAIQLVLQSPFWESRQIESRYLKSALEDLVDDLDDISLDLTELYEKNRRLRLEWVSWDID